MRKIFILFSALAITLSVTGEFLSPPPSRVFIPQGTFTAGIQANNWHGLPEAASAFREVWLPDYWISRTEVTNAEYSLCFEAGACHHPLGPETNPQYWNPDFANHPVVFITWHGAQAYCSWDGGRLPTELEWEKAARGAENLEYPWGNTDPMPGYANIDYFRSGTSSVGEHELDVSPYGAVDMAGNVREWVDGDYDTGSKVLRGASWFDPPQLAYTFARLSHDPGSGGQNRGFRCAYDFDKQ